MEYPEVKLIDIPAHIAEVPKGEWVNSVLAEVDGAAVRLGVIEGEYHWHVHQDAQEFFMTLQGQLLVDVREDGQEFNLLLSPLQACVIPAGIEHRTRANERTAILMIERAGIIPEGD